MIKLINGVKPTRRFLPATYLELLGEIKSGEKQREFYLRYQKEIKKEMKGIK